MKRLLAAALLSVFFAVPASATNLVNFIGLTANSVGMGGTGVSNFTTGTDALYKNPSLLTNSRDEAGHFSFDLTGGVIKQPEVSNYGTGSVSTLSGGVFTGDAAITYRVMKELAIGAGFLPYGGAVSDYTGQNAIFQPKNNLTLMRVVVGLAYQTPIEGLSIGVAPFLGWNRFALNESVASALQGGTTQTTRNPSEATDIGFQVGATYKPMPNLAIAASYTSRTSYVYKGLIAIDNFGPNANPSNPVNDFTLAQPDEIAAGVSFSPIPELTIAFDYRNIGWSRADGYREFGFATQNVVALGGEFRMSEWAFRAGVNYTATPLADITNEVGTTITNIQGHAVFNQSISMLDVFAFPGISTTNITAGVGYSFLGDMVNVNVAGLISPDSTLTRSGTGAQGAYAFTTTVSQWAVLGSATARF